jgi:hypothetical protein
VSEPAPAVMRAERWPQAVALACQRTANPITAPWRFFVHRVASPLQEIRFGAAIIAVSFIYFKEHRSVEKGGSPSAIHLDNRCLGADHALANLHTCPYAVANLEEIQAK